MVNRVNSCFPKGGHSATQTELKKYDGLESPMLHTKFRGNRPAGSGEDFKGFLPYIGRGGHLGHGNSIKSSYFHFLVHESFHKKSGSDWHLVVSEKIRFEFLYVHYLEPRSRNDLDLQYSPTFIYSIR